MTVSDACLVVGAAWAAMVVATAWARRPPPRRPVAMNTRPRADADASLRGTDIGARMARHPVRTSIVFGMLAAIVHPIVGVVVAAGAGVAPVVRRRAVERREAERIAAALPDVADLFVLVVGSGLNARLALDALASRAPPAWRPNLESARERVALGQPLADSRAQLGHELGEPAWPLTNALAAAERDGTPLLPVLHRVALDARAERRRTNEAAARRLPVKLLFPLVVCILPAFALLTVAPLLAGALRSLRL